MHGDALRLGGLGLLPCDSIGVVGLLNGLCSCVCRGCGLSGWVFIGIGWAIDRFSGVARLRGLERGWITFWLFL